MISSLVWIPKGSAKSRPARYEVGPEELQRIKKIAIEEQQEAGTKVDDDEFVASGTTFQIDDNDDTKEDVDISDLPPELKMDEYDDEDVNDDTDNDDNEDGNNLYEMMDQGESALALDADSEDEDAQDDEIKATDAVVVVASTEDEFSHLEVHLYSDDGNLYTHHDITLKDFPLCLAWMDCPPFLRDGLQTEVGSYVAVGSFDPAIEIWNLDVLDPLEPSAVLGGQDKSTATAGKKKKSKKTAKLLADSHTEAVMGLSWNTVYRQALASSSADHSVKVWDVTTQNCSLTLTHHMDKVQSVSWHPFEAWLLASGSFDKTVAMVDCRSSSVSSRFTMTADTEALRWDPLLPFHLYCALEDGQVTCMDVRHTKSPLFSFQAHNKTVSSLSFSPSVPGLLATASIDKTVRMWDVRTLDEDGGPKLVMYKSMNVGKLFALDFFPSDGYMLACGGDGGMVAIWESDEAETIRNYFDNRVPTTPADTQGVDIASVMPPAIPPSEEAVNVPGMEVEGVEVEVGDIGVGAVEKKKKKKKKKAVKESYTPV
eukprot:gene6606-13372_t